MRAIPCLVAALAAGAPAAGDPPCDLRSFVQTGEFFAWSVNMRGPVAIVGSPAANGGKGLARVYRKGNTGWMFEAVVSSPSIPSGSKFGEAAAIHGDYAVVGAADGGPQEKGSALIFRRVNGAWVDDGEVFSPAGALSLDFGASVAITGLRIVVGDPRENGDNGGAHVFVRGNDGWEPEASFGEGGGRFGWAVAYDGARAVIGAPEALSNQVACGLAHVYRRDTQNGQTQWVREVSIFPGVRNHLDYFGASVAVSGSRLLVAAPGFDVDGTPEVGKVYFYKREANAWLFKDAVLPPGPPAAWRYFGLSAALDGDTALASWVDNQPGWAGTNVGRVSILGRTGEDWREHATLSSHRPGDYFFGYHDSLDSLPKRVSLSAGSVVVGETGFQGGSGVVNFSSLTPTTRVSVNPGGGQASGGSSAADVNPTGRLVVFQSSAANLVAGDTNGKSDIFLRNRLTGTTVRLSMRAPNTQADGHSYSPSVSADGSTVAFATDATNLDPLAADSNGVRDICVWRGGVCTLISRSANGFGGNGASDNPRISANGRYVVFQSAAANLVDGDTNNLVDVFIYDLQARQMRRVSLAHNQTQAVGGPSTWPSVSDDGRFVAFASDATNLVPGDTYGKTDIFVRDLLNLQTERISRSSFGHQANARSTMPRISGSGRFVVYTSLASNLTQNDTNQTDDVFRHDREANSNDTIRVSVGPGGIQGNKGSAAAGVSMDGDIVLFNSRATNLVGADDTNGVMDVFIRDVPAGATRRIGLGIAHQQPISDAAGSVLTPDGNTAVFHSAAGNLVPGDTGHFDVFLRDVCDTP